MVVAPGSVKRASRAGLFLGVAVGSAPIVSFSAARRCGSTMLPKVELLSGVLRDLQRRAHRLMRELRVITRLQGWCRAHAAGPASALPLLNSCACLPGVRPRLSRNWRCAGGCRLARSRRRRCGGCNWIALTAGSSASARSACRSARTESAYAMAAVAPRRVCSASGAMRRPDDYDNTAPKKHHRLDAKASPPVLDARGRSSVVDQLRGEREPVHDSNPAGAAGQAPARPAVQRHQLREAGMPSGVRSSGSCARRTRSGAVAGARRRPIRRSRSSRPAR